LTECTELKNCPFFNNELKNQPALADLLKFQYCKTNPDSCARLQARDKIGPRKVPTDLAPNQHDRLKKLMQP
jgi:hypothetical protein